jgi:hypothetical protein
MAFITIIKPWWKGGRESQQGKTGGEEREEEEEDSWVLEKSRKAQVKQLSWAEHGGSAVILATLEAEIGRP